MRTGIYARISQDTQGTELGVMRQQDDCRREAERRGWRVVDHYVDNDVSATRSKSRPQYQRMLGDIEAGKLDAIVVYAVDRLTRSPRELEDIIDLASAHGIKFANVTGTIDLSTPEGRAMARQMGTFARLETENMSRRLKRKFQEKAERGEPHGYAPYGFERVSAASVAENPTSTIKRDVPHQEHSAIVREVADRALNRESLRSIVADLNARGIPAPKSSAWSSTILRQVLLRPANAGLRSYLGKVLPTSTTVPIYDRDTYDRLTALLTDPRRKSNHVGPEVKYLLSGIALCGLCGAKMRRQIGRVQKSKSGAEKRQPPSYQCATCFRVRRHQLLVDEVVTETVIERLSRPDAVEAFSAIDTDTGNSAAVALEAVEARLTRAAVEFAKGTITGDQLVVITKSLQNDRDDLLRQVVVPNVLVSELTTMGTRARWNDMPLLAKREVVESLMMVTVLPSKSGAAFDPALVKIDWMADSAASIG